MPELRRPYILSGYRGNTFCGCWKTAGCSVFHLNNETGNIAVNAPWIAIFAALAVSHSSLPHPHGALAATCGASASLLAASSVAYHGIGWFSREVMDRALCVYASGIVLTVAAFVNWGVFVLFSEACAATYVFLSMSVAVYTLTRRKEDLPRAVGHYFAALAVPAGHAVLLYPPTHPAMEGAYFGALLVLTAAVFRLAHFPENRCPGRFDFVLQSHQLWHFLSLLGTYLVFRGFARAVAP